jgi:hypothetical protein
VRVRSPPGDGSCHRRGSGQGREGGALVGSAWPGRRAPEEKEGDGGGRG